jgi:hypothetical protein
MLGGILVLEREDDEPISCGTVNDCSSAVSFLRLEAPCCFFSCFFVITFDFAIVCVVDDSLIASNILSKAVITQLLCSSIQAHNRDSPRKARES